MTKAKAIDLRMKLLLFFSVLAFDNDELRIYLMFHNLCSRSYLLVRFSVQRILFHSSVEQCILFLEELKQNSRHHLICQWVLSNQMKHVKELFGFNMREIENQVISSSSFSCVPKKNLRKINSATDYSNASVF